MPKELPVEKLSNDLSGIFIIIIMIKCGQELKVQPKVYKNDVSEVGKNIVWWSLGQTSETET